MVFHFTDTIQNSNTVKAVCGKHRSVPRCIRFSSKQLGMLDQCGRLDSLVLPLCGIGGQLLLRGTILTSGVLGGLSTIAICGPSEKFFNIEGIFNIAVSAIVMSSLGQCSNHDMLV